MNSIFENLKHVQNEFEEAHWDETTGLAPELIAKKLEELQHTKADIPWQTVYAEGFAYLLDNLQLEINEHTPFSVKLNLGIDFSYFASPSVFNTFAYSRHDKVLAEKLPKEFAIKQEWANFGLDWMMVDYCHTVPGWNYLLENGFAGILKNAEESKEKLLADNNHTQKQIEFLDAVIVCFRAILRLLERIYTYSLKFNVPEFSECVKNISFRPPQSLYEVMLFSALYLNFEEVGMERGRTLGPIDRMYLPYFEKDLENGKTEEELKELFRYYFMHFTAEKRYAEQPFTMCGCDKDGNDFTNRLSHIMLDAYDELNIYNPKIQIRYHKNLNKDILRKALSMIRKGNSSICIVSDETVFKGYEKIGVPIEDAQNYVLLGCYEPIIMGLEEGEIAALRFNMVKCIEFALNGGKDIQTGTQISYESETDIKSFEEFFNIFLKHLDNLTDFSLDFIEKQGEVSTLMNAALIYSASFKECIEKGMDVHEYPLKYNNLSLKHHGHATTVDSLVAVKKYVFDRQEISLEELREALKQNWKGYEALQSKIIADTEKYGNNLPLPDKILTDITNHLADRYCGKKLKRGGVVRLGMDSVYHCVVHGRVTSATPDGRNAGQPISKNLCASDGMDRGGITAYMQSVLKIDSASFVDGVPLDFILHPSAVEGEKGLDDFASLVKIFLDNGGFCIQGNIVSQATLKDAQLHPEKYSTLQVRVCGWNEYFVKLSKVKQDMFIKQCEVSG